jgi:isopentenyldiphosphate isomerase
MLIDNNRVYLQKRSEKDLVFPGLWDTAISNHIKVSETLEQCIQRTAEERYRLKTIKPLFLSNYVHETDFEYHYAFLFVACYTDLQDYNKSLIDHAKWWTVNQIEENLDAGIFTDNFKTEFDLLKRSGLLESVQCECECSLKDLVLKSSKKINQN